MLYRTPDSDEFGFEDEYDELEAMRDFVQNVSETTTPGNMMDTLVVLANICEYRALMYSMTDAKTAKWYRRAMFAFRIILEELVDENAQPNIKLEDLGLYFPEPHITH